VLGTVGVAKFLHLNREGQEEKKRVKRGGGSGGGGGIIEDMYERRLFFPSPVLPSLFPSLPSSLLTWASSTSLR